MKKSTLLILVIIAAIIVAIIFLAGPKQKGGAPSLEESAKPVQEEQKINLLAPNASYKCIYRIEENLEVVTYFKNGKMRTEIKLPTGDTSISLYSNNKVYQWSEKEKQGFFMSIDLAKQQPSTEIQEPDKYAEEMMTKYKPDCQKVNLAENLFVVPNDVQFQDMSQLFNLSK